MVIHSYAKRLICIEIGKFMKTKKKKKKGEDQKKKKE